MTSSSTTTKNKPLKWTTQRVNNGNSNFKPTANNRVHKRTPSNTSNITRNNIAAAIMTAEIKTNPREEIERLQSELEFTYDTVATITVHFESLHHAYTCSKPELDKSKSATRLGEMEKELLTAYDDLGLQVTHLERKISKLEKRLTQLRELESIYVSSSSSPIVKVEPQQATQQQVQQQASPLIYDLISSPCSSTDSSIGDYQLESSGFYCDDWTLSQIMNNEDQQAILFDQSFSLLSAETASSCNNNNMMNYPASISSTENTGDYYQELYCDLTTMNMYNTSNSNEFYLSYPSTM
jgi:hypothetical protein